MEFSFSGKGGEALGCFVSHLPFNQPPTIHDLGFTGKSVRVMVAALQQYFQPGTYDLLRKNCNSFSDCALFYLLGKRLDTEYRSMEKIGAELDKYAGLIRSFTGGTYRPNPRADNFKSCHVVVKLEAARCRAPSRGKRHGGEDVGRMVGAAAMVAGDGKDHHAVVAGDLGKEHHRM